MIIHIGPSLSRNRIWTAQDADSRSPTRHPAGNAGGVTVARTHLGRLELRSFALATATASGQNSTAPPPTVIYLTAYLNYSVFT